MPFKNAGAIKLNAPSITLRLLVYSYFPILNDHQAGGAQFAMRETLRGFATKGMNITVLCPETDDSDIFKNERIRVLPVLKEKARKSLTLHERARNLRHIAESAENADVIWTLDASFPLKTKQPIVLTLNTIAYEDELNSFWDFNWDVLVVASHYLGSVVEAVAGAGFWSGTPPPVKVIPNGIDTKFFVPTDSSTLLKKLNLPSGKYILFPHRPEAAKGFDTALFCLKELLAVDSDYKLLIPTNPRSIKSCLEKEQKFYRKFHNKVEQLGLASSVIFHPWISLNELPSYYSLGESCLMLSSLPEGFGFTTIQSVSCGTPVISTKAGALRERLPPDHAVTYVEVGDVDSVVSAILAPPKHSTILRGQEYIRANYSLDRNISEYLDCFKKARKKTSRYFPARLKKLRLSPWCYFMDDKTIWHDLEMKHLKLTRRELKVIRQIAGVNNLSDLDEYSYEIEKLLTRGVLSPLSV